jgi:hypothetical protein
MLTRRRVSPADDEGMTLAELLVSCTVGMIVLTFGTLFFVSTSRSSDHTAQVDQALGSARTVLGRWNAFVRVAGWLDPATTTDRFEEITPTKLVFYAGLGNRSSGDLQLTAVTKVALMLDRPAGSATGRLVEVVFGPDNRTPRSVRRLPFQAGPSGTSPVFQPYNVIGGDVGVDNTQGCLQNGVPAVGLCLQAPPSGAGLLDPQLTGSSGNLTVTSGPLVGNPGLKVDQILNSVAGIRIAFTAYSSAGTGVALNTGASVAAEVS